MRIEIGPEKGKVDIILSFEENECIIKQITSSSSKTLFKMLGHDIMILREDHGLDVNAYTLDGTEIYEGKNALVFKGPNSVIPEIIVKNTSLLRHNPCDICTH